MILGGFRDVSKEAGWAAPATQPAGGAANPIRNKDHSATFGEDLLVVVKPTVIVEHDKKE